MNARLTLNLKKNLVERAKEMASERGISLSKFIEKVLEGSIGGPVGGGKGKRSAHADIERLVGVIKLPEGLDVDQAREAYLRERYGA